MPSVLIPLAQGCEELEAVTVIDLLRRASIDVTTAGLDKEAVVCSRGTVLIPDSDLDSELNKDYDMIVLPGGLPGADHLNNDSRVRELLVKMANSEKFTAAICAAPKVLASTGLLNNRRATSFPGALSDQVTENMTYEEVPVVQDGKVITSRGPGTAMDFALSLIEALTSKDKRNEVESALQRPA
jgi:4-methyl-5(b-hydroxyethyl)-thiazole monophosphate biosynthesis